jgi:N-acetylglutamate synthase-like GNAT family acetyltransferase
VSSHPFNKQAAIREAQDADAAKICEVLVRSVREICAPDYNNDEAVLQQWCSNKTPEVASEWIRSADYFIVVAQNSSSEIVGAAMYNRARQAIELCYVVPEALHRGIGSQLLATLEADAARLGHKDIYLCSSITAREFYRRHGYVDDGEPVYWGKVLGFPMRKIFVG